MMNKEQAREKAVFCLVAGLGLAISLAAGCQSVQGALNSQQGGTAKTSPAPQDKQTAEADVDAAKAEADAAAAKAKMDVESQAKAAEAEAGKTEKEAKEIEKAAIAQKKEQEKAADKVAKDAEKQAKAQEKLAEDKGQGKKAGIERKAGAPAVPQTTVQTTSGDGGEISIVCWNVRGYPENKQSWREWFTAQLDAMKADAVCLQRIAGPTEAKQFSEIEKKFTQSVFKDTPSNDDNAIFAAGGVVLSEVPGPAGFEPAPQTAFIKKGGFDAVVVSIQITKMDMQDEATLRVKVASLKAIDPDIIICGTFAIPEEQVRKLAASMGMEIAARSGSAATMHDGKTQDYVLVSSDLAKEELVKCETPVYAEKDLKLAQLVSDHLPIRMVFRTDAKFADKR